MSGADIAKATDATNPSVYRITAEQHEAALRYLADSVARRHRIGRRARVRHPRRLRQAAAEFRELADELGLDVTVLTGHNSIPVISDERAAS